MTALHGVVVSTLIFYERIIGGYYSLFVTHSKYVKEVFENNLYHVQELQMMSSVTKIVMNPGSQLSVL